MNCFRRRVRSIGRRIKDRYPHLYLLWLSVMARLLRRSNRLGLVKRAKIYEFRQELLRKQSGIQGVDDPFLDVGVWKFEASGPWENGARCRVRMTPFGLRVSVRFPAQLGINVLNIFVGELKIRSVTVKEGELFNSATYVVRR